MCDFESNHGIVQFIRITRKQDLVAKSHKLMVRQNMVRQNNAFTGFWANHTTSCVDEISAFTGWP
jgi:hypothetical protein